MKKVNPLVLELIVHMWSNEIVKTFQKQVTWCQLEWKTNSNNINFLSKFLLFPPPYSVSCCWHSAKVFWNCFAPLFERTGIVPICVADRNIALWTRSVSATKIVSERHCIRRVWTWPWNDLWSRQSHKK